MGVTHTFVSGIADDPAAAAAGQVLPSHWNATHTVNVNLASEVSGVLPVANGGSGTATPSLVAGTNITVSGTWPNQTIDAASGGTPGGSTTQLQYNNAGAFGGASGLTTNGTELTIASGTKTANAPLLDATQTWNNAAITFTGLKFNATDTASNAASLLMDLQVGGTSKLKADKTGNVFSGGSVWVNGQTNSGISYSSFKTVLWHENSPRIVAATASVSLEPTDGFGWRNATGATSTVDINLFRDAAGTLAQRNGTNAQAFRVYNTYTDASNYERVALKWVSNVALLAVENAGTGGNRAITLQGRGETTVESVLSAITFKNGGTNRWQISVNGHLVGALDNTYDIGASGATRPRIGYFGTRVDAPTLRTDTAYTVATLPAAGVAGRRAYVTDATAPTYLGALTGGGSVVCPVFDNGTAWVAG